MKLYQINIPVSPNGFDFRADFEGKFGYSCNLEFETFVIGKAGGMTKFPEVQGVWINEHGQMIAEKMIPYQIACTAEQIAEIAHFAKVHYEQEVIFVAELGEVTFY